MCCLRVGDVFEGGAGGGEKARALRKELGDLEQAERSLDEMIHSSTAQLKKLTEYKNNQKYPSHTSVPLCTFSSALSQMSTYCLLLLLLTLDPTLERWAT